MDAALRALAHPGRRAMLRLVRDGERSATELAEASGMSGPAASQHLKVLRDAGLVTVRSQRTMRLYRLEPARIRAVRSVLDEFWDARLDTLKTAAEALHAERSARQIGREGG